MMRKVFKNPVGSVKLNAVFIFFALVGGVVLGLALSQGGKEKNISPAELLNPVKAANASSVACAKNETAPVSAVKPAAAEKSILRVKDYIKTTEEKNNHLKEKVGLLDNLLSSKEKELVKLNSDNAQIKDSLNKAIEAQNKLKSELENNIVALNSQISKKDTDIASLATAKAGLENQLSELNKKLAATSADYAALEQKSQALQQDKEVLGSQLNGQISKKDADIANLTTIKAGLENQLSELNKKLAVTSADYAALEQKSQGLAQDKEALDSRLNRIREDLDKQESANGELEKKVSELTESLAAKEKERSDIARELQQLITAKSGIETELAQLKTAKSADEETIKQLNNRIGELSALYEEAKKSLFQISGMLTKKEQEINDKQNEIAVLKESLTKADGGKALLLASLDEKEKTVRELNLALNSMESRIAAMQKDIAAGKEQQAKEAQALLAAEDLNKNLKNKLKNIYIELEMIRAGRPAQGKGAD